MDIDTKIKKQDRFFLYLLPSFFVGLAAYVFIMLDFDLLSLIMVIPFLLMSLLFHLKHKKNISFKCVEVQNVNEAFHKCLEEINSLNWEIVVQIPDSRIVAHTKSSWRSWGELITLCFEENRLLINSRPSPFKKASILTWGKNRSNLKAIETAVKSG